MATIQISKSLKLVPQTKAYQRALLTSLVTGIKALAITAVTVAQLLQKHKYSSKTELCKPFRSLLKGFVFLVRL